MTSCPWCSHPDHIICRIDRQHMWSALVDRLAGNIRAAAVEEMRVRMAVERVRDAWSMA